MNPTAVLNAWKQENESFFNEIPRLDDITKPRGYLRVLESLSVQKVTSMYSGAVCAMVKAANARAGCMVCCEPGQAASSVDFDRIYSCGYGSEFKWWKDVSFGDGLASQALIKRTSRHDSVSTPQSTYVRLGGVNTEYQSTIVLDPPRYDVATPIALVFEYDYTPDNAQSMSKLWQTAQHRLADDIWHVMLRIQRMRMEALLSALNAIAEEVDLDKRLEILTETVSNLMGPGEVAVLGRDLHRLPVLKKRHLDKSPDVVVSGQPGAGYTSQVARTHTSFYCRDTNDIQKFPHYRQEDMETRAQYTVPLLYRQRLVGVLNVGVEEEYGIDYETRQLLEVLAAQLSNVLWFQRQAKVADNCLILSKELVRQASSVNDLVGVVVESFDYAREFIADLPLRTSSVGDILAKINQDHLQVFFENIDCNSLHVCTGNAFLAVFEKSIVSLRELMAFNEVSLHVGLEPALVGMTASESRYVRLTVTFHGETDLDEQTLALIVSTKPTLRTYRQSQVALLLAALDHAIGAGGGYLQLTSTGNEVVLSAYLLD